MAPSLLKTQPIGNIEAPMSEEQEMEEYETFKKYRSTKKRQEKVKKIKCRERL